MLRQAICSFLFGLLGALFVFLIIQCIQTKAPTIGTVHLTQLVDHFIQSERKKNVPQARLEMDTKQFGKQLEMALKKLAEDKGAVLLPNEAVIAGAMDYTAEADHLLNEQANR